MDTTELALRLQQVEDCQDFDTQAQAIDALNFDIISDGLLVHIDEDSQISIRRVDWND